MAFGYEINTGDFRGWAELLRAGLSNKHCEVGWALCQTDAKGESSLRVLR